MNPQNLWLTQALELVAFFVMPPAVAVSVVYRAWRERTTLDPKKYGMRCIASGATALVLFGFAKWLDADVRTPQYFLQLACVLLCFPLFGACVGYGFSVLLGALSSNNPSRLNSLTSMDRTEELKRPRHAFLWALIFVAMTAAPLWIVVGSRWNLEDNPVASRIALAFFFVISVAPYWMLYDSWQHDRKLTRKMWFFFVPGGFLWYYFEVYRQRSEAREHEP